VNEGNLGHFDRRDKYAAHALKLADRLTPRERFYVEGYYYNQTPATVGKSMEAYRKCLEVDPGHVACRHNLALQLNVNERYREGIAEYEEQLRRGTSTAAGVGNLTLAYIAVGELDKARVTAEAFVKQNPGLARAHGILAGTLMAAGRLDEALRELTQTRQLAATDSQTGLAITLLHLLREDWQSADETAKALLASADETARFFGAVMKYSASMLRGRSTEALQWAEKATVAYKANRMRTGNGHQLTARALAARGQFALAVPAVTKAVAFAKGTPGEVPAALLQALILPAAGRPTEVETAFATLATQIDPASEVRDRRNLELARGLAALAGGNAAAAVAPLQAAAAATPPRGGNYLAPSVHLVIWSSLGQALLESGKPAEALPWFRQCADSGFEHIFEPVGYVRSFYFLGRIYEQQGDSAKSREAYRRFVGYWKDGDLDRERIAEAQRKIAN
jgi:tetratricopeptide (TPR) repeat protein